MSRAVGTTEVTVGLHPGDGRSGWRRVLEQEGLPYVETTDPRYPIMLARGAMPAWSEKYVAAGGILVVSGAEPVGAVLPSSTLAAIQHVLPPNRSHRVAAPCLARLYRDKGEGEVRLHEDRITKNNVVQDRYPLVCHRRIGRGALIYTGVPLTSLLQAAGDRLRRFSHLTGVTERVSSIDKADLVEVLVGMLRSAFAIRGMPYVRMSRFPEGAPSVLLLRVDVDGAFGARAKRIATVAAAYDIKASFFINASTCEANPGDLRDWPGEHEIGQHGYTHNVFDSEADNRVNLVEGACWVASATGRTVGSFVAPRGLWNDALDAALAAEGYPYSSDFSIDFDSLPFRTSSGILQIPVHPYSPERAAAYAEEHGLAPPTADSVRDYYLRALRKQVRRRRPAHFYGHPQVLGAMADEVLPAIFDDARNLELPTLTLNEFSSWWSRRERADMRLFWNQQKEHMHVEFGAAGAWSIDVVHGAPGKEKAARVEGVRVNRIGNLR